MVKGHTQVKTSKMNTKKIFVFILDCKRQVYMQVYLIQDTQSTGADL